MYVGKGQPHKVILAMLENAHITFIRLSTLMGRTKAKETRPLHVARQI